MSKYCMSCGAANTDNASVCTRCGKRLPHGEATTVPMNQNAILGQLKKQVPHKGAKYGIGIAALCVVIIVLFVLMGNRGIEGTWKGEAKNRDRETDGRWLYTIKFNEDNAGYLIWETPDAKLKRRDYLIEWRKIDESKYVITCPETSDEVFIEPGSNEFVVESNFCAVEHNTVFHRE